MRDGAAASRSSSSRRCAATIRTRATGCTASSSTGWRSTPSAQPAPRALYYPYVEPRAATAGAARRPRRRRACAVVTDWYPAFFLPRMLAAAGRGSPSGSRPSTRTASFRSRLTARRSPPRASIARSCSAPPRARDRTFPTKHRSSGCRRAEACDACCSTAIADEWPAASDALLTAGAEALAALPIDHRFRRRRTRGGTDRQRANARGLRERRSSRRYAERAQPSRCRRHEPAVAIPAFRAHLRARGLLQPS